MPTETIELKKVITKGIPDQASPIVKGFFEKKQVKLRVALQMLKIINKKSKSIWETVTTLKGLRKKYQSIFGETMLTKVAKVNDRYFWRLAAPGFPSEASLQMQSNEVNRMFSGEGGRGLRSLLFAITKKCPLKCQHCFEWDNLNQPETLSAEDIIDIVHKYQDYGTTQIMLSGGEPMLRINDIHQVLRAARNGTDFWIISSGLGLSEKRAQELKSSGLTGVMVSLDHFRPEKHNQFRGFEDAYSNAIAAVVNANGAGLVTTLSLCATREFTSESNLAGYLDLAKELGVSFVQIVEPRASGRYRGKEVLLRKEEIEILEETYLKYNNDPGLQDYPIINYLGYHQRRLGCFGGGDRFFYIDTDGDAHLCPFCCDKVTSTLNCSAEDTIEKLTDSSCHSFARTKV